MTNPTTNHPVFAALSDEARATIARCIVRPNDDTFTLWDCDCGECLSLQRDWYRTNDDDVAGPS